MERDDGSNQFGNIIQQFQWRHASRMVTDAQHETLVTGGQQFDVFSFGMGAFIIDLLVRLAPYLS